MQSKLTWLETIKVKMGLRIIISITKVTRINTRNADKIELDGEEFDEEEAFAYLNSNISKDGGYVQDIQVRIGKATVLR